MYISGTVDVISTTSEKNSVVFNNYNPFIVLQFKFCKEPKFKLYFLIFFLCIQATYMYAGAGGAEIIWGPRAGAENKFKINIFCSQFGGC